MVNFYQIILYCFIIGFVYSYGNIPLDSMINKINSNKNFNIEDPIELINNGSEMFFSGILLLGEQIGNSMPRLEKLGVLAIFLIITVPWKWIIALTYLIYEWSFRHTAPRHKIK